MTSAGNGAKVSFKDLILDEDVGLEADLVVLDLGMVPNSGPDPYAANESQEGMPTRKSVMRPRQAAEVADHRSTRSLPWTTARARTCRS